MTTTLSQQINDLFVREDWRTARALIEKEIAKRHGEPGHWLLDRLATTYYEERKYKTALKLLEQARSLAPDCPLVLWDYAGTLDALGRSQEAIDVYMELIGRGPDEVGREECGEGLEWATNLLTDCFYRVSVCLKHLDRPKPAWEFFVRYARLVVAGAHSLYADTDSQVMKHVVEVLRKHPGDKPRSPRQGLKEFSKDAKRILKAA